MKFDFLCVGYAKCGTTSLDGILRQYKQITLPLAKVQEPHFFWWKDDYKEPLQRLYTKYYGEVKEGQCVGMVDPTLSKEKIQDVDFYFGEQTKIIVMLRNPVKALFSDFRMGLRSGFYWGYFVPFKKSTVSEKFEKFIEHCENKQHDYKKAELFRYDKYLESLYEARKKEDIKIIIFEEFVKDQAKFKSEIEKFLGLRPEDNINYDIWLNSGKKISKNYFCARINNSILKLWTSGSLPKKALAKKLRKIIHKYTLVENNETASSQAVKRCEDYYRDSKNKVAELTGKDLDHLWFQ